MSEAVLKHLNQFVHDDDVAEEAIFVDAIEKAGAALKSAAGGDLRAPLQALMPRFFYEMYADRICFVCRFKRSKHAADCPVSELASLLASAPCPEPSVPISAIEAEIKTGESLNMIGTWRLEALIAQARERAAEKP